MIFCSAIISGPIPNYDGAVATFDAPAIVLVAHNTHDGQYFSEIRPGNMLRYYTGEWRDYRVVEIVEAQAVDPDSEQTHLLIDGRDYSPAQFHRRYLADPEQLILITCIYRDGSNEWGRLVIIGEPLTKQERDIIPTS